MNLYVKTKPIKPPNFRSKEDIQTIEELRRRNAELQRELTDIKESYRNVLAEPCESDDRVHCTCVPALRAEIKRLREDFKLRIQSYDANSHGWQADIEHLKCLLETAICRLRLSNEYVQFEGDNEGYEENIEFIEIAKAALKEVDGDFSKKT